MQRSFHFIFFSTLSLTSLSCLTPLSAKAQVTPDGTTSTTVNQNGNNFVINEGDRSGDNLFHSFNEFSVPTLGSAVFNNAGDIANIFSRVTGSSISNIDGVLGANGTANLYLINPNGIIFGENARLNLGGSFFASTADSLLFEGNTEFSAVNLSAPPLLEVSIPIGLSFRDNPGDIVSRSDLSETVDLRVLTPEAKDRIEESLDNNLEALDIILNLDNEDFQGENRDILLNTLLDSGIITNEDIVSETVEINPLGLQVSEGKDFALIGGNILIENSGITAPGGDVTIGGLTQAGIVLINEDNSFTFPEAIERSNISIRGQDFLDSASINTISNTGGSIFIDTNNLTMNFSELKVGLNNNSLNESAENIDINANSIILDDSVITSQISDNAVGTVGDINLTAQDISLKNFSFIVSDIENDAEGTIGNISINADYIILNESNITTEIEDNGRGIIGDININANSIFFENGDVEAEIDGGSGSIGNINLIANSIELINNSRIDNRISNSAAEIINFETFEIEFITLNGFGSVGDINLTADSISLNSSVIQSALSTEANTGQLGDINLISGSESIDSGSISLANGSIVRNRIFDGIGEIGEINLTSENILLDSSAIQSNSILDSILFDDVPDVEIGIIEDINLTGKSILINNDSDILSSTNNVEQPSDINVVATKSLQIIGLSSTITTETGGTANAGNILINAPSLNILDRGQISANNFRIEDFSISDEGALIRNIRESPLEGTGNAGTININSDTLNLETQSGIVALSSAGVGGNINLQVNEILSLRNNSEISATAGELNTPGNGGNINIDSQLIVAFPQENNDITANAFNGQGGNININTQAIFGLEQRPLNPITNDINASSEANGLDGTVDINNPAVDPTTGLIELPTSVGDASDQISQNPCQQGIGSQFIVTGKGGLPPDINQSLNSESVQVGLIEPVETTGRDRDTERQEENVNSESLLAQGWVFNEKGEVTLTAYRTTDSKIKRSSPKVSNTCSQLRSH